MNSIDKRWLLAIALGVAAGAAGAAVTSKVLRRRHLLSQHRDHAEEVKAWENEGGNLAPPIPTATPPIETALNRQ